MTELMVGMVLGVGITTFVFFILAELLLMHVRQNLQKVQAELTANDSRQDARGKPVTLVRVEEHDGIYYLYDAHNDAFMVQGDSLDALENALEETQWRKHHLILHGGDRQALMNLLAEQDKFSHPEA